MMDYLKFRTTTDNKAAYFTKREKEILSLLPDGLDSRAISEQLHVSLLTIQTHRRNMQLRHKCPNTAALISLAFRNEIIK